MSDQEQDAPRARPLKVGAMAPSRVGKINITAYLSPAYKRNLRLIQANTGQSLQALIAESLNDLFRKHGLSVIEHD